MQVNTRDIYNDIDAGETEERQTWWDGQQGLCETRSGSLATFVTEHVLVVSETWVHVPEILKTGVFNI